MNFSTKLPSLIALVAVVFTLIAAIPIPTSDCDITCGFRTQTIGGWGATPKGNNPGKQLHDNFYRIFPNGITIGYNDKTLTFTNPQAVTDFLPCGGKNLEIDGSYTDPSCADVKSTFASQILALAISIKMNYGTPTSCGTWLADLEVAGGIFEGRKVSELLYISNCFVAGYTSGKPYTSNDLLEILTKINENFVDGKITGDCLVCPSTGRF